MSPIVITYLAYILVSVSLTIWVAHTLHKNGRIFLIDVFHGQEELADSVNHLLVVGFYLLNLGLVSFNLKLGVRVSNGQESIEALSSKIGMVLIVLASAHFMNLYVFSRIRRRALSPNNSPPVVPPTQGEVGRYVEPVPASVDCRTWIADAALGC